jgi:Na+-driven multidrug efflux pump
MTDTPAPARPSLNKVAVPIVGEFLLGISVAMAGLYLASHTSDAAAGAFGLAQQVQESLAVLFRILAIGLGVMLTQYLGGQRHHDARQTAYAALGASTWVGLLAALWLLVGGPLTLDALNAPAAVRPIAMTYMMLLAPAMVLEVYNLSMASVLRAHLFARESLMVMLVMHGCHLAGAWLLMRGVGDWTGWGLNGYAAAWFFSRLMGLVLHLRLWRLRMGLRPTLAHAWRVPVRGLLPVLRIGLPGAALEFFYRMAFMVSLAATARWGVEALATHSYILQILKYVLLISMSVGWACEIMVGRLVGAGQLALADAIVRKGVRNGLLASGSLALLAAAGAPWLMQLFTRDPSIVVMATTLLWLSVALELGRVFNLVVIGALRAAGDVHFPVLASSASLLLILGAGSYWMGRQWGLVGIWLAYVADECLRGGLMWWRWHRRGWLVHARQTLRQMRQKESA